ncbi:hypothetical protein H0H87_000149 [Tephrocybe sp. NHM501043]|nr:hypothetical protein H0H87_000149 [Tephrocybe sp. NHM501043]
MAGLLEWSNSIRFTMTNDPGREIFQGQLNTHGFIFLNDYLDNILSGPSQDPIIELVKTPGRKKMVSKKPKALGLSKLRGTTSPQAHGEGIKENTEPVNAFHKALLKVKTHPQPGATNIFLLSNHDLDNRPSDTLPPAVDSTLPRSTRDSSTGLLAPGRLEQNSLSVIAEDDEHESTGVIGKDSEMAESFNLSSLPHSILSDCSGLTLAEPLNTGTIAESSSDIFHSITLDSPPQGVPERIPTLSIPPLATGVHQVYEDKPGDVPVNISSPVTLPLPITLDDKSIATAMVVRADDSKPSPDESRDFEMPLRNEDPAQSGDKFGTALFPTLPAPMPLRKSVRVPRDPSVGTGPIGAATPSASLGGKRTSWLKKAREVKALELAIKHTNTPLPSVQPLASQNVLKRKSDALITPFGTIEREDAERYSKSAKMDAYDEAPHNAMPEDRKPIPVPVPRSTPPPLPSSKEAQGQEGMLDRFKKTVEDLGARVGKSTDKSIGAAAVTSALAEARAAAEARVAERHNKAEEMIRVSGPATALTETFNDTPSNINTALDVDPPPSKERRLSISDLFPSNVKMKDKSTSPSKNNHHRSPEIRQGLLPSPCANDRQSPHSVSATTTPPDSPPTLRPTSFVPLVGPVFNKPSPVFVPPIPISKSLQHDYSPSLPPIDTIPIPAPMTLGLGPRLPSPSSVRYAASVSRQSTMESVQSAGVFDDANVPAWMAETQDTDYSSRFDSQSQNTCQNPIDEDDSWPIDEKLGSGVQWSFGGHIKEDSMTWSTLPSQSQRGDTATSHSHKETDASQPQEPQDDNVQSLSKTAFGLLGLDPDLGDHEEDGDSDLDNVLHEKPTISLVEKVPRSESQLSLVSSQSSQSQSGFFSQASKFLGNALGTSKKGNDVKKVLQMAAVAAKKQQEESDKKAARLKEMENRRHLAIQRKAEEERTRILEHEKKVKEEGERRKREREENTDKRPLKTGMKKDEDLTKKRRVITADGEKRELKKPLPKPALKSSLKAPSALSSSAAYNASQTVAASSALSDPKTVKPPTPTTSSLQKSKGKAPNIPPIKPDDDLSQPSQLVQIQMAARAKAQIQAAHLVSEPPVTSESIELPEINSEYSDSDDEDRPKSFPEWAQSPELRQALQLQSTINPDDIFGAIRPLRMEELFKTRTSRFRARTSSANWTGADRLTMEEEREYAKRMGFK